MSKLDDRRSRHDTFYRRAKKEKYASRAVYKLQEIDRRCRIFKKGQRVLDLGCWPGSWIQYAASKVGKKGRVVGVDRKQLKIALPPNAEAFQSNVFEVGPEEYLSRVGDRSFDVVLSDMAPDTTGVRISDVARSLELFERVLEVSEEVLRPGGHMVAKVFQGSGFDEALQAAKNLFGKVKTVYPKGSRRSSMELYVVGMGRREKR